MEGVSQFGHRPSYFAIRHTARLGPNMLGQHLIPTSACQVPDGAGGTATSFQCRVIDTRFFFLSFWREFQTGQQPVFNYFPIHLTTLNLAPKPSQQTKAHDPDPDKRHQFNQENIQAAIRTHNHQATSPANTQVLFNSF